MTTSLESLRLLERAAELRAAGNRWTDTATQLAVGVEELRQLASEHTRDYERLVRRARTAVLHETLAAALAVAPHPPQFPGHACQLPGRDDHRPLRTGAIAARRQGGRRETATHDAVGRSGRFRLAKCATRTRRKRRKSKSDKRLARPKMRCGRRSTVRLRNLLRSDPHRSRRCLRVSDTAPLHPRIPGAATRLSFWRRLPANASRS